MINQPAEHDKIASRCLVHMKTYGEPPPPDDLEATHTWKPWITKIADATRQEGKAGYERAYKDAINKNKRLMQLEATYDHELDKENRSNGHTPKPDPAFTRTASGVKIFRVLSDDDIDQAPDGEYLYYNLVPKEAVSLIVGDAGVGKTFFGIHMARCIAHRLHWLGRAYEQEEGLVLYIYAEGASGIKKRVQGWRKHYGVGATENFKLIPRPTDLQREHTEILATIDDLLERTGKSLRFVVFDTFSSCTNGLNQSSQEEVASALRTAHDIKDLYHCHVMAIHHTNKNGDFNGSQAFKNHVDTMIGLYKDEEIPDIVQMRCLKQRDDEPFSSITLNYTPITLGTDEKRGTLISTRVVTLSVSMGKALTPAETLLGILEDMGAMNNTRWTQEANKLGIKRNQYEKLRDQLVRDKKVKTEKGEKNATTYATNWEEKDADELACPCSLPVC